MCPDTAIDRFGWPAKISANECVGDGCEDGITKAEWSKVVLGW